jgi:hypothetical protein
MTTERSFIFVTEGEVLMAQGRGSEFSGSGDLSTDFYRLEQRWLLIGWIPRTELTGF